MLLMPSSDTTESVGKRVFSRLPHRLFLASLLFSIMGHTSQAASVSSNVTARIGNTSGAIYIDNGTSGYPHTLPSDTIFRDASLALHYGSGTHVTNLANAAFGVAGSWYGTSIYGEPNRTAVGGGLIRFIDEISVESNILADNTPVNVDFAFYATTGFAIAHSMPDPNFGQTRLSSVDLQFSGSIRGTANSANDIFISSADHRRFEWLGSSNIETGILDPNGSPLLQLSFGALVGDTINLIIDLRAVASGAANPFGPNIVTNGSGYGAVALAFGATPASSDVSLQSAALAGAFPDISAANLGNAQSALIAPVPLPLSLYLFIPCALFLFRRSRR